MSLLGFIDSPIHSSNKIRVVSERAARQFLPLLLPINETCPDEAKAYYAAATDQTPGNKLSLLEQALLHGSTDSGRILINFARPDGNYDGSALPTQYLRYLLANVLCRAADAITEFETMVNRCRRLDTLYECQDILQPYADLGYDISHPNHLLKLRRVSLGGPFQEQKEFISETPSRTLSP